MTSVIQWEQKETTYVQMYAYGDVYTHIYAFKYI